MEYTVIKGFWFKSRSFSGFPVRNIIRYLYPKENPDQKCIFIQQFKLFPEEYLSADIVVIRRFKFKDKVLCYFKEELFLKASTFKKIVSVMYPYLIGEEFD